MCTYGPLDWAGQTTCHIDRVKKRPRDFCEGSAAKCPRFSELDALDNQASLPVACSPRTPVLRAWGFGHAAGCKQGSCKPLLAAWTHPCSCCSWQSIPGMNSSSPQKDAP